MNYKDAGNLWYTGSMDVFLNRWFVDYDEAKDWLENEGGFLLPYQHQFFICEAEAIRELGLMPDDPDWERISRDCARPADVQAFVRLRQKREQAVAQRDK